MNVADIDVFVFRLIETVSEERNIRDVWMYKVGAWSDISYEDFKRQSLAAPSKQKTGEKVAQTVKEAFDILNEFDPEGR